MSTPFHIERPGESGKVYCGHNTNAKRRVSFTYGTTLVRHSDIVPVCDVCVDYFVHNIIYLLRESEKSIIWFDQNHKTHVVCIDELHTLKDG